MERKKHLMTTTIDRKLHVVGIGGTMREGSTSLLALEKALRAAEQAFGRVRGERKGSSGGHARRGCAVVEHGRLPRNARGRHQKRARLRAVPGAGRETLPARQSRGFDLDDRRGMAAVNAIGAMVNTVHALRGVVAPLSVPVTQSWKTFDEEGNIRDEGVARRLESLGRIVVEMAAKLGSGAGEHEERTLQNIA